MFATRVRTALLIASIVAPATLVVPSAVAQTAPKTLTLGEAVSLAKRNSPTFLSVSNDQEPADWQVREAYAAFLPTAFATGGVTYQEPGTQRIGTLDFGTANTDYLSSTYGLRLNWNLDAGSFFQMGAARARRQATQANISSAEFALESAVTLQYMVALRARDAVDVARRQLDRAQQNLELATVRAETGAAAMLDAKQAQVERGRAEVALIRAERGDRAEKLRLTEQLGLDLDGDVELVSAAEPVEPAWSLEELLDEALSTHPALRAAQARERSDRAELRAARSGYFPAFSLSTGFTGYAVEALNTEYLLGQAESGARSQQDRCQLENALVAGLQSGLSGYPKNCSQYAVTDALRASVLQRNEVFPFNFTKNPLSVSFGVSVPIFNGFSTQRQVEEAAAATKDAVDARRAEELGLRSAVTQAYDDLVTQYQVIAIERTNRELADERLTMARQRYAAGAANILELLDAQSSVQAAESDYLSALYDYQIDLTRLEAASGVRLRPTT